MPPSGSCNEQTRLDEATCVCVWGGAKPWILRWASFSLLSNAPSQCKQNTSGSGPNVSKWKNCFYVFATNKMVERQIKHVNDFGYLRAAGNMCLNCKWKVTINYSSKKATKIEEHLIANPRRCRSLVMCTCEPSREQDSNSEFQHVELISDLTADSEITCDYS